MRIPSKEPYDDTQHEATSRGRKGSAPTIGDVLGYLLDGHTDAHDMFSEISGGAFNTWALTRYSYSHKLALCCAVAIQELADLPCTQATRADVMGRAMEILRGKYDVNAPRGWYPVMKQLRGSGSLWASKAVLMGSANKQSSQR